MATELPATVSSLAARAAGYRLDVLFPSIGSEPDQAEVPPCLHCGCQGFHRHQRTSKLIKDQRRRTVYSMRYLCKGCGRSVRLYPPGVSARRQSDAIRGLSVALYRLGLSHRSVQKVLTRWECPIGVTTIWENVRSLDAVDRGPARRGRVTIEVDTPPGRITFPADGPDTRLRLVTEPEGTMRLEIRTREDWRSVWQRVELHSLTGLGMRLIGARRLVVRPRPELATGE